jgi:hypothetical protein
MTHDEAHRWAEEWVSAWNRHDVDAVIAPFADGKVVRGWGLYDAGGCSAARLIAASVSGMPVFAFS